MGSTSLDLHDLRRANKALDALADTVQTTAAAQIAHKFQSASFPSPVLITGSSGYLGRALVLALRNLGVPVRGLDVAGSDTTDVIGSVCDPDVVDEAGRGCRSAVHTAALHAPHAGTHSEAEYSSVNVDGTKNVLNSALSLQFTAVVHTSTTSLMVTDTVKAAEDAGMSVILDQDDKEAGSPRNKYGRTKLEAEKVCCDVAHSTGLPIVILRTSRFFPEDDIGDSEETTPNLKANELLGRRAALVDILDGHLRALLHATSLKYALFTLSAPSSLTRSDLSRLGGKEDVRRLVIEKFPQVLQVYERLGWIVPDKVRVYDCSKAIKVLGWQPVWTFEYVLNCLEGSKGTLADALFGRY